MEGSKATFILWGIIYTIFFLDSGAFALNLGLIDAEAIQVKPNYYTILDARPRSIYLKEHIPGAHSFSWEDYTHTDKRGIKYRLLPPEEIAKRLEAMCINNNSPIVIYGDLNSSWGGEGWAAWVLAWLGHTGPIRLLKGGIKGWKILGYPTTSGNEERMHGCDVVYYVKLKSSINITASKIMAHPDAYNLVDVRSFFEWLKGHIPGATRIPWEDFYKRDALVPITRNELTRILLSHHVDLAKPVVYYCTGGVRSGLAWFVHELSGLGNAINFEGGIEEWNHWSTAQK